MLKIFLIICIVLFLFITYPTRPYISNNTSDIDNYINNNQEIILLKESGKDTYKQFSCDGRQYCSQMHSCSEAKFFLQNCPNPKMDGDMDGIPCEKQWCH